MKQFISWPEIGQFRNVCKSVEKIAQYKGLDENDEPIIDINAIKPKLKFTGTVKSHGTNASISFFKNEHWCQSRKNIITIERDNAGFAFFAEKNLEHFKYIRGQILAKENEIVTIHGEFCGGNIQKGVAISGLPKMFIMFGASIGTDNQHKTIISKTKLDGIDVGEHDAIYHIKTFKQYEIEIDFENAQKFIPELVNLTESVEEECPIGNFFGRKKGIDNVTGEGIVWRCDTEEHGILMFKTKGEKHSNSKSKKIKVTVAPEVLESIDKFVEYAVNDNRLNQAYNELDVKEISSTGKMIKWVMLDVCKEEQDVLVANNLEPKQINGAVARKVRTWFINKLDSEL